MSRVYDYYSGGIEEYISRMGGSEGYPTGGGNRDRRGAFVCDENMEQTDELVENVFTAFAEQARETLDNPLVLEIAYHVGIFIFQLGIFLIVRAGSQKGITGHF